MSKKMMKKKNVLKQLLDSPKFNMVITIVNVVVIIGVVTWLLVSIFSDTKKSEINAEGESIVEDVDVDKMVADADATMPGIYKALLAGSDFDCGNGMEFHFGYFYGVFAAVAAVVCVNYIFTYPYFAVDFTIAGYPITFLVMLAVAIITSALMTQIKRQEQIRTEIEKFNARIGQAYVIHTKNLRVTDKIIYVPAYMTMCL